MTQVLDPQPSSRPAGSPAAQTPSAASPPPRSPSTPPPPARPGGSHPGAPGRASSPSVNESARGIASPPMTLKFQPHLGTLWMCNFGTGFKAPEMVKKRPVVVISPRPKRLIQLCTVVPLSTVQPNPVERFHHQMNPRSLQGLRKAQDSWAKCDMLYTVSLERLSWIRRRTRPLPRASGRCASAPRSRAWSWPRPSCAGRG